MSLLYATLSVSHLGRLFLAEGSGRVPEEGGERRSTVREVLRMEEEATAGRIYASVQ
jgi:hypothetical protein